jgi:type I restriction enzyme S subunit
MSAWPIVTLRDVSESVQYGYTASASHEVDGPQFLRITDIAQDALDWPNVPRCEISSRDLERFRLRAKDIVVARTGATVGYAKFLKNPPEAVFASYLVRFRIRPDVDAGFVGAIVQSEFYKSWVRSQAGGSAQPNANAQVLGAFPLHLPPLDQQRRIASILGAYDDLIEVNRRRVAVLEATARGLFEEWFVRFRFPGHENHKIIDTPNGPLPEGWQWTSFSALASFLNGFAFKPSDFEPEGLPVIKIPELKNGISSRTPFNSGMTVPKRLHVQNGDLLFSWSGTLAVSEWTDGPGLLNQHLFLVVPNDRVGRGFLKVALQEAMPRFLSQGVGATMTHIRRAALDDTGLALPIAGHILGQADAFLARTYDQVVNIRRQNQGLAAARDLLLPRLISGELSVAAAEAELEAAA